MPEWPITKATFFDLAVYDSEALGTKLQMFHDSIVLHYTEETWTQWKRNKI